MKSVWRVRVQRLLVRPCIFVLVVLLAAGSSKFPLHADEGHPLDAPPIVPVEAEAAGCKVSVLAQYVQRTFYQAVPVSGWKFSHWDGYCYLNPTFQVTYILESETPPVAVFVPQGSAVSSEGLDTRRKVEIFLKDPSIEKLVEGVADWLLLPTWDVHSPRDAHPYGARSLVNFQLQYGDYGPAFGRPVPETIQNAQFEDINGEPLVFEDGVTPFFSMLNPSFQEHVRVQVREMIDSGADGLWFDGPEGAVRGFEFGGPFDKYSLAVFRDHLKSKYSKDKLRQLGISDVDNFDYRNFIIENGYSDQWCLEPGDVPFFEDYRDSLQSKQEAFECELFAGAKSYSIERGREVAISINADPFLAVGGAHTKLLDFYFAEISHFRGGDSAFVSWDTPTGFPLWPWFKYAQGQGKYLAVLQPAVDSEYLATLSKKERTELVLHILAEAWANMGAYCIGVHPELDTYMFDKGALYPYFGFVRENPDLLVDLASYAQVAIVSPPHPSASQWHETRAAIGLSLFLGMMNINHDIITVANTHDHKVVVALGSAWSDAELEALLDCAKSGSTVLIVSEDFATLDQFQHPQKRPVLSQIKVTGQVKYGKGKVVFFDVDPGFSFYRSLDPATIAWLTEILEGEVLPANAPANVVVVPYVGRKGVVIHLINYAVQNGRHTEVRNALITVDVPAFVADGEYEITFHSPDEHVVLRGVGSVAQGRLSLEVPVLRVWTVAQLELLASAVHSPEGRNGVRSCNPTSIDVQWLYGSTIADRIPRRGVPHHQPR